MILLQNALKYTLRGYIKIKARVYFDYDTSKWRMRMQVRDTGIGIKYQEKVKLFKLFGNNSGQNKNEGIGLSLAIVKLLINQFQGEITCFSKPNQGTLFSFNIPLHNSMLPDIFIKTDRSIESSDEELIDENQYSRASSFDSGSTL